ncbi:MAG: gamma-glutamyltransferase, partial [Acidimicrobiales bacterium]
MAASAALAVTTQHMCGMGGDLWAVVHEPGATPTALNASGRAGSGSDAAAMRAEGHTSMPFRGDLRSVPVPGCVDGWTALHERYGTLPLDQILQPAIELAELGFPASPHLGVSARLIADVDGNQDYMIGGKPVTTGQMVRRPGIARSLRAIAADGRSAWYEGEFGDELIELGRGLYSAADLARLQADWVEPTVADAWGHHLWTAPPNSQGYLSLAGAVIANGLDLPDDPDDPRWAHLLIEAAKQAG